VTTLNQSGQGAVIYDPNVVTITNAIAAEGQVKVGAAA
jgi:hypothetical protein